MAGMFTQAARVGDTVLVALEAGLRPLLVTEVGRGGLVAGWLFHDPDIDRSDRFLCEATPAGPDTRRAPVFVRDLPPGQGAIGVYRLQKKG